MGYKKLGKNSQKMSAKYFEKQEIEDDKPEDLAK